jgi:hypothetical protein
MATFEPPDVSNGICIYRPHGTYSLVETVDLISAAIAYCRDQGRHLLLVDVTGINGLPIPTLVDRFLMVEDWAQQAKGTVVVAMVVPVAHMHPLKFGVKVALHFGLICDVYGSEEEASKWLSGAGPISLEVMNDVIVCVIFCQQSTEVTSRGLTLRSTGRAGTCLQLDGHRRAPPVS